MPIRGIVLLAFFLLSLPICLVRPFYGIVLWTIVAFLNPQSYIWGAASVFPWALGVAIPTIAGFCIFSRGWKNLASGKILLMVILWSWFTITSIISTGTPLFFHHAADTWARWQFVSKVLLMTAVSIGIMESFAQLRTLVLVIAGCFGFFVAKSLPFMIITRGAARVYGPERSMIADNNDFGLALNMTLPLFLFLAQTESRPWVRRLFGFLFVITIPAIFFTYSRGALFGLVVVAGLMLLRLKQRMLLIPVAALGIIVALLFAPEAWKQRMDPTNAVDASARERFNAWTFSWNLAKEYPIAGGGFATFTPELFSRYAPVATDIRGPHSIYFGVLAEHGFVGLFLYLLLVLSCFATLRRILRRARYYEDTVIANYARMFNFSLVAFLTSGMFLGRAYFDYFFTIVACLTVLERVATRQWAARSEEVTESPLTDVRGLVDSMRYRPATVTERCMTVQGI